jgi:hypothetical protein
MAAIGTGSIQDTKKEQTSLLKFAIENNRL